MDLNGTIVVQNLFFEKLKDNLGKNDVPYFGIAVIQRDHGLAFDSTIDDHEKFYHTEGNWFKFNHDKVVKRVDGGSSLLSGIIEEDHLYTVLIGINGILEDDSFSGLLGNSNFSGFFSGVFSDYD